MRACKKAVRRVANVHACTFGLQLCNSLCHECRPLTKGVFVDAKELSSSFVSGANLEVVQRHEKMNRTSTRCQIFLQCLSPENSTNGRLDLAMQSKCLGFLPHVAGPNGESCQAQTKLKKVGRLHWELQGRHVGFLHFGKENVRQRQTKDGREVGNNQ